MHRSRELDLLLSLLQASVSERAPSQFDAGPIDWDAFLALARFHRVQGLVWRELAADKQAVPAPVAEALAMESRAIAAANLRAVQAAAELSGRFSGAGLPLLFVKGLTLAGRLYGDAWTKTSVDIDILVAPEDLRASGRMLDELGYRVALHDPADLELAHRRSKESSWKHSATGVQVDLHTRLADNPRLIPDIGLQSPRQSIAIADGVELPTLADQPLLAYLAVHGASSAWFRIKWAVDFAALAARLGPGRLQMAYESARTAGAGRAVDQALLVADALFGSLEDAPSLKAQLLAQTANRRLARTALRLACISTPREPTEQRFGTVPIHLTQLMLRDDWAFKASELSRQVRTALLNRRLHRP